MALFYRCQNNGTIAIAPEAVYQVIEERQAMMRRRMGFELPQYSTPIFTFTRHENLELVSQKGDGTVFEWCWTGDYELMDRLLAGHAVLEGSFYVPFSNSREHQGGADAQMERRFRTTAAQLIEHFGLITPVETRELLSRAARRV